MRQLLFLIILGTTGYVSGLDLADSYTNNTKSACIVNVSFDPVVYIR